MKRLFLLAIVCAAAFVCAVFVCTMLIAEDATSPKNLAFRSVPFTSVQFGDAFWSPRLKTNRDISIPHNYKWCEDTGRFTNFAKAAKLIDGKFQGIYFNDSDVYKLLEGTAYSLADHPDAELKKRADDVIAWIAAAQQPNGYLNTYYELAEPDKKWTNTHVMHELYCAGHMIEAAVAYFQATGDRKLLDTTEKFLAHIRETFGREPGKKVEVPGHEEIELALIKLYQLTGKPEHLELAKFFVDVRGDQSVRTDKLQGAYSQDHKPVREQSEIVGHAVRAMYLFAGVADVAGYTGDKKLVDAMHKLWNDVVNKKMYVTGGIGARHEGEAFGEAFELPNQSAYCETCAAIGLVLWAHRLNLMHGDAKYADIVERAIYNGVLSGIGRDGKSFFYVNPLASAGNHHRQPFFDCACCPTNVVRFVPSLPGYQYATDDAGLVVNQFVAGDATIDHPKFGKLKVSMQTNFPWDGEWHVRVVFEKAASGFTLKVRVPAWTPWAAAINANARGYLVGVQMNDTSDVATANFTFPMEIERIVANPLVEADRGRVAILRGPLVYCFEQCDNEVAVDQIVLAAEPQFAYEWRSGVLGGLGVVTARNTDGRTLTAVPYFAWDTREAGKMAVWVRQAGLTRKPKTDDASWTSANGEPILYRTLTPEMLGAEGEPLTLMERAIPAASFCGPRDSVESLAAGNKPKNSDDHECERFTFWDHKGSREWIEYTFDKPEKLSRSSVYWFDDSPRNGGCRVPKSWTLLYRRGDDWVPVKTYDDFATEKDRWNNIDFEAVETTGIRIEVILQENFSGGVLGWNIDYGQEARDAKPAW